MNEVASERNSSIAVSPAGEPENLAEDKPSKTERIALDLAIKSAKQLVQTRSEELAQAQENLTKLEAHREEIY